MKEVFFAIADRLVRASDEAERKNLKEELARLTPVQAFYPRQAAFALVRMNA